MGLQMSDTQRVEDVQFKREIARRRESIETSLNLDTETCKHHDALASGMLGLYDMDERSHAGIVDLKTGLWELTVEMENIHETVTKNGHIKPVRIPTPFGKSIEIPVEPRDILRLAMIALMAFALWLVWGVKKEQTKTQTELRAIALPRVAEFSNKPQGARSHP